MQESCLHAYFTNSCCSPALRVIQAFKDQAKLLTLLRKLISRHASLATTPAKSITAATVKELQQLAEAVGLPDASVKWPIKAEQASVFWAQQHILHLQRRDDAVCAVPYNAGVIDDTACLQRTHMLD